MEGNKDEAYKCISIAQSSLASGDFKKALKFAEKSIRLFPTGQGEQLLKTIQIKSKARPSTTTTSQPKAEPDRKHTPEQSKAVKTILACGQDYYKVLSVERTATDIQIKKAYRKLALQFHPDKNSAPGADEAFKLISKAFDTLSDNQKRAIHDSGGDRIRHTSGGGGGSRTYNRQQYYYQQQQQDDFLNMFFGNNVNRRYAYDRRRRATTSETENMTPLIPIILVAFLFLFSILFSFDNEPIYSFRPSQTHTNVRFTKTNNVKYYAQPQFETTVRANQFKFKSIERQIESDWLSEVRFQCQREQRRRADLMTRAEGFLWGAGRDQKLYKQAEEMKMPNCDEARRLMTRIH